MAPILLHPLSTRLTSLPFALIPLQLLHWLLGLVLPWRLPEPPTVEGSGTAVVAILLVQSNPLTLKIPLLLLTLFPTFVTIPWLPINPKPSSGSRTSACASQVILDIRLPWPRRRRPRDLVSPRLQLCPLACREGHCSSGPYQRIVGSDTIHGGTARLPPREPPQR